MDLLLLEGSMTAFVDISFDSFYLTCFQIPCCILSVFKNCLSWLKFRFGLQTNEAKKILHMACYNVEVPEAGHSARQATYLFPRGQRIYFKQCHFLFNYRWFCIGRGKEMASVSKEEHVSAIKGYVVLYQKVAFKPGKD